VVLQYVLPDLIDTSQYCLTRRERVWYYSMCYLISLTLGSGCITTIWYGFLALVIRFGVTTKWPQACLPTQWYYRIQQFLIVITRTPTTNTQSYSTTQFSVTGYLTLPTAASAYSMKSHDTGDKLNIALSI